MKHRTVDEVIDVLYILGCDSDPIWYYGLQTTPTELQSQDHIIIKSAKNFNIQFYSEARKCCVAGTIMNMVQDRLGVQHGARKPRRKARSEC